MKKKAMPPDDVINTRKRGKKGNKATHDQHDHQTHSHDQGEMDPVVLLKPAFMASLIHQTVLSHFHCDQEPLRYLCLLLIPS